MGGIPSNYTVELDFGTALDLSGIPSSFDLDITSLPKIQIGLDPITLNPISVNPLDVSVRLKEIPSVRAHIPANYTVGMSILGLQLFAIRLCGEAQVITQPYVPNPCEECGIMPSLPAPPPANPPGIAGGVSAGRRTRKKN